MKTQKHIRNLALATSIATLLATPSANADALYWDNTGGTANDWGSLANWSTDVAGGTTPGALPGTGDVATFSATPIQSANQTVNLNANRSVLGLEFLSGVTATTTLLGGGTNRSLTLGASGIVYAGSGNVTIGSTTSGQGVTTILAGSQSIANNGTGQITFNSAVSGSGSPTFTNNGTGTGIVRFNGGIASNVANMIQDSSTSKLQLGGVSSATINTTLTVTSGTLEVYSHGIINGSVVVNGGIFDTRSQIINTSGSFSISSGRINLGAAGCTANGLAISGGTIFHGGSNFGHSFYVGNATISGSATFNANAAQIIATSVAISGGDLTGNGTLAIGGGGLTATNTANASLNKVRISTSQNWANNGTAELLINGTVTGNFTPTLTNNGTGSGNVHIAGALQSNVGSVVQNSVSSRLVLSGTNLQNGATSVNAGTLTVAGTGSINNTSALNVAAGGTLHYNSSTALTVAPTLAGAGVSNRAVLGGTGRINTVTLDDLGDVLAPGNSPGILSFTSSQNWSSFSYDWEVNDFTSTTAGTAFDQIGITGVLALSGGSGSYILNVLGLTAGDVAGLTPNFSEINRSWTILTTGGITSFDAVNWRINTAGFSSPYAGTWNLAQSGPNLVLSYAAVPEPNVAALLGGLGMLALVRRRRW